MKNQNESNLTGENKSKGGEKIAQKSRTRGKTPKQVVDKHIKDKDDVISDEEFKNLDLNLGINGDVAHEPLDIPDKKNRPKDEGKDHEKITPWDVIE